MADYVIVNEGTAKKVGAREVTEGTDTLYHQTAVPAAGVLSLSGATISNESDITLYPLQNDDPTSDMLTSTFNNFTAANCIDDNTSTKGWDTNGSEVNSYLQIDLGSGNNKDYVRCKLYLSQSGYDGAFKIQYSDNGTDWTDVVSSWTPSASGWNTKTWDYAGKHRYWRLLLVTASSSVHGDFMEMEWYSTDTIDCAGKGHIILKTVFSQADSGCTLRLLMLDSNSEYIGLSEEVSILGSDFLDGTSYLGEVSIFQNKVGASKFKIWLKSITSGSVTIYAKGV